MDSCGYSGAPRLAEDSVPSVMLLPAGRGRAEEKQNRTSSDVSGEQLQASARPWGGEGSRGSGLCVLLSPLRCPGPALLSVGHVLLSNTPLLPPDIGSNAGSIPRCRIWEGFYFVWKTASFVIYSKKLFYCCSFLTFAFILNISSHLCTICALFWMRFARLHFLFSFYLHG